MGLRRKTPTNFMPITVKASARPVQETNIKFAHLQHLTNVPTKFQLPTPYGFQDIARTRFSNSRSLQQGQKSNQGHTMTLHTYTPQPMPSLFINFLHLMISETKPGQTFVWFPITWQYTL